MGWLGSLSIYFCNVTLAEQQLMLAEGKHLEDQLPGATNTLTSDYGHRSGLKPVNEQT